MEVKVVKRLNYLPHVFLTPDLNKFSTAGNAVDCFRYISRSGLTQEGCIEVDLKNNNNAQEVRGIYYTPIPSAFYFSTRQKSIKDADDLISIINKSNLLQFIEKVTIMTNKLLIAWDNTGFAVYDRFAKGHMYEFPIIGVQGHLTIFQIPSPKYVYNIYYEDNEEKKELKKELFVEVEEFMNFNHKITFSKPVLEFKDLYVRPGAGALIYTSEDTKVKLESSDHEPKEININRDTWVLFSHPRPRRSGQD